METAGSIGDIMTYIPHSTHDDEARFIILITDLIAKGELVSLPGWESSRRMRHRDWFARSRERKRPRRRRSLRKELGVWDEFYGTGKTGARRIKGRGRKTKVPVQRKRTIQHYRRLY